MLEIKNFLKYYGDHLALSIDEVRFDGGLYWIKGENGSGKTTFFRSLAGLLPCKGTIQFTDGPNLADNPVPYRRLVNYSEAEPTYPGFLTARDLFRFVGTARNASMQEQHALQSLFGIDQYQTKPCETYSSGMMKKVSLALAFLGRPQLLILDEPLITLDEQARSILLGPVNTLIEQYHTTVLVSSHQAFANDIITVKGMYVVQNKTLQRA